MVKLDTGSVGNGICLTSKTLLDRENHAGKLLPVRESSMVVFGVVCDVCFSREQKFVQLICLDLDVLAKLINRSPR